MRRSASALWSSAIRPWASWRVISPWRCCSSRLAVSTMVASVSFNDVVRAIVRRAWSSTSRNQMCAEGSIAGNTYVSVFGRGLNAPVSVRFGSAEGLVPVLENGSVIGVRTPPAQTGTVDVLAGTAGGEQTFPGGSGSHAFYFLDPDGNRLEVYCWMMTVTGPSLAAPSPDL